MEAKVSLISFFIICSCFCHAQVYIEGPAVDSVCYGSTVNLTCSYPNIMDMVHGMKKYSTTRSEWAVNGTRLLPDGETTSTQTLSSTSERLDVTLTKEQFGDRLFNYSCYLLLYNGSRETSSDVEIAPPEHPLPPTLREPITTTPSAITLEVDHRNTCFENCTFQYEVKVHPAGSHMSISTTTHSTNVFNVSGLSGGTRYRAEIVAVCVEESTIRSDPLNVNFTTRMEDGTTVTPATPPDNGTDTTSGTDSTNGTDTTPTSTPDTTSVGLVAGVMVTLVIMIATIFGIGIAVIRMKSRLHPQREEVRNEEVSYQTVQYADLYFSTTRPIPAPASDKVCYSDTVGDTSRPPKIPKKAATKNAGGTFQKDILANMDGSGILLLANNCTCLSDSCSKCDHTSLKTFPVDVLAVYKDTTFVANCLEDSDKDITIEDVSRIIEAKQGLEATKGFLICNQDFMSMDLLVQLEENDCFFVGVGGHGKENWDERMLDKLTSFFT